MLSDWPRAFDQQKDKFETLTGQPFSQDFIQNRKEILERLRDITGLVQDHATWTLFKKYIQSPFNGLERLAFIRQTTDTLEGFLAEDGIEFSLEASQLSTFALSLRKAIESKQSAVSGLWWGMFSKEKKVIERIAAANGLGLSLDDLHKLELKGRNRKELESWLSNKSLGIEAGLLDTLASTPEQQHILFFQKAEAAADAMVRASLGAVVPNVGKDLH